MQLLQSARLVSLGQMAAGVAHELNQPLTMIETTAGDICLRLIEDLPIPTEELRAMMENVREVVERMAGTIDHLRVFSRDVSEDPRRELCLNEVVLSSLKMIGKQLENHGIDLKFDLAEDLPKVWGHPHPLEQVFLNLLANARDAVDEGRNAKQIFISTRRENGHVLAEVTDSGIGMDQATQQRLFEPFFTTKEADRGTGLGLSIVYAIVRNHDGHISCVSEPGAGATFRVVLPAVEG
jgi:histidine kinase